VSRAARHGLTLLFLLVAALLSTAQAHEVRPGYLEVRQVDAEAFEVLWKVPAKGEYRLRLHARLPKECRGAPIQGSFVGGAFVERWRATCPGGLAGRAIDIEGLSATRTDVLARIEWSDGTNQVVRLTPEQTSFVAQTAPGALAVAQTYFVLGVEHILLGIDHLLFVLALLILVDTWRRLVWTITAFTLAHSITLVAATLGWVAVPPPPVEAVIALSIVFVAGEIIHARQGRPGIGQRLPWLVAFTFGLLHGFGFAGALSQIGLPQSQIPLALFTFNVGVEAGQLLFVGAVLLAARLPRALGWRVPAWWPQVTAYAIGSVAMFWVFERVAAFVP
jgi:hydrogenase/urease accessory protein HupE